MSVPESRAERLAAAVVEADLDSVIVGDLVRPGDSGRDQMADIAWLTGFGGSSGLAVIGPEVRAFVTDFRYTKQLIDRQRDEERRRPDAIDQCHDRQSVARGSIPARSPERGLADERVVRRTMRGDVIEVAFE